MDSLFPLSPLSGLHLARQQSIYYEALEEEAMQESNSLEEEAMGESKALEEDTMQKSESLEEPMATSGLVFRVQAAAFVLS